VSPFPVGILTHSHSWKAPNSTPEQNIADQLWSLDHKLVLHPRESLDYLCVSDLATWSTSRLPYMPPSAVKFNPAATHQQQNEGVAYTAFYQTDSSQIFNPVASLITHLYIRLSYFDSTLRSLADNLLVTGTLGSGKGPTRVWSLDTVFSDEVRQRLPGGMKPQDNDWGIFIV
jgi:hypothetical protein